MKHTYLFCPCQGHFIEGGIKDAAITGQTGAEEKRRSELAIIRSHTLGATNKLAQVLQTHKHNGTKDHAPLGVKLTTSFLNEVEKQTKIHLSDEEIKIAKQLLSKNNQYKTRREDAWLTKIITARKKNKTIEKRGVDYTPGIRKLIPYHTVRKNIYIPQVKKELDERQVEYDNDDGVKKLVQLLKLDEDTRHKEDEKSFRNLTEFIYL